MHRFLVVIETDDEGGYSAYVPDLPGCVAAGETREEVEQLIHEAVELHLEDMVERGEAIPKPRHIGAETVLVKEFHPA